ncbi:MULTISPECIES: sensor domain-containing phosphodiesterase [Idiomarina]|uniref:sensor domain-containing phosphodiesterase n=1 Tax=Idiomarina TaxID=135575 RepID=UPI001E340CEF|nr:MULTISPECIES: diguanylate cyclase [Idiomarina]
MPTSTGMQPEAQTSAVQNTESKEITRLRKAVARLQKLALKYRQSEVVQKALFKISELASSVQNMQDFYASVHAIIGELMDARNFYICLYDQAKDTVQFVYFVDEYDDFPALEQVIPAEVLGQGLTGYVMRTGKPFLYDIEVFGRLKERGEIRDLGSPPVDWLGVPLRSNGQVVGAMVVQSYSEQIRYTEQDQELLLFVSQHIVNALDRVRQREYMQAEIARQTAKLRQINDDLINEISVRERAEKLTSVLFAISEITNTSESMQTFYEQLYRQIGMLINNDNFFVALINQDRGVLEFPYSVDAYDGNLQRERKLAKGMTEYVIRHAQPVFIDRAKYQQLVQAGEVEDAVSYYGTHPTQWLGSPLVVEDEVIGVLSVQTYVNDITYKQDDLELLNFVSQHVAVAIERRRNADEVKRVNAYLERKVAERTEELVSEIERRKKVEEKLFYDAHHDALTGLPNRSMFTERLQQTLKHKKRFPHHNFAVLFVDLDRFKNINDTLGHSAGDEFLLEASRRIGECIRDNDTVARLGGDEFVILLDMIRHIDDARDVASRIIEKMRLPFVFGESEHYSGASVGIAECKSRNDSAERLLRDADAAMYQAKSMGRGRYVVFDESIHQDLVASLHRETELRHAQFDQDFVLQQFTLADLRDNTEVARELQLRWQRDDSLLPADRFNAVADKTGMTLALDHWMLKRCCAILQAEDQPLPIYVGLSSKHLYKLADVKVLIDIITNSGVAPESLILEFSETELNDNSKRQLSCLRQLAELGVGLALNEFGRSAGALQFILNYPFTHVKLDPRFVADIATSQRAQVMVRNVVHLCRDLAIEIAAAGVDNHDQLQALIHNGVNIGQGQLFGEPQQVKSPFNAQPTRKSATRA